MTNRLQKKWVFTWNAGNEGYLPKPETLQKFLCEICSEAVFQLEAGEATGREHYQGRFILKSPRTSKKQLLKKFSRFGDITNLTFAPEIAYDSSSYCEKSETRVDGPWYGGLQGYLAEKQPMELDLYEWQTQLLDLLTGEHQDYLRDRKVIWIQGEKGNNGKSTFIKYLAMNDKKLGLESEKLPIDRPDRVRSAVIKLSKKKDVDLYMFDFTRTQGQETSFNDLFEVIEEIKNGYVVDIMYGNFNRAFLKPAIIMILTNEDITKFSKYLSYDRWESFQINNIKKNSELVYLDLSNILADGKPDQIPFEQYLRDKLDYRSND